MRRFLPLLFALLSAATAHASGPPAQVAPTWYPGVAEVPLANLTPEQARRRAWEQALAEAVEAASLEVTSTAMLQLREADTGEQREHFSQLVRTVSRARVVAVDTLFDDTVKRAVPGTSRSDLVHRVQLRAGVVPEDATPDPAFQVDLRVERSVLHHGEGLVFELTATRPCYVTVFALYGSDSLQVVLPNPLMPDTELQPGQVLRLPPRGAGWDLPVWLLPGRQRDQETLLAVGTRGAVPFTGARATRDGLLSMGDALLAINRWLMEVPASERTIATATYELMP